jgi:glucosamine--fructose-6-phosphate aminotransferase (isomerizing)
MCGIVGYIGTRSASHVLLDGLRRLEYRGYDSAGLAVHSGDRIQVEKEVGKVADLEKMVSESSIEGMGGIGHTRWATHGGVTTVNAHPHFDSDHSLALVHNGIIENYMELRQDLEEKGITFLTETDTEVAAQLLSWIYRGNMVESLSELSEMLDGSFALAIILKNEPGKIYCIKKGSPLVLGMGDKESFCASDVPALLPYTREFIYLEDGDIAELSRSGIKLWDSTGREFTRNSYMVDWDTTMAEKSGYPHFMLKEINEQGRVLRDSLKGRIDDGHVDLSSELSWNKEMFSSFRKMHIIACGTSYYAALVAERFFEQICNLDIRVEFASEYRYRNVKADGETLSVFVSQSGETADTLAAERKARSMGAHCLGITNVPNSTLGREVDSLLEIKAGPEIGVAATKTFTGQLVALYLLALQIGNWRETLPDEVHTRIVNELIQLPYKIEWVLEKGEEVREIAEKYAHASDFLYLGRGSSFPVALEGALKLKEISYIHAEAYAAGEMKHGPIALLDPEVPVVVVVPSDYLYGKVLSNIQEARARKAPIISIATDGDTRIRANSEDVIYVPPTEQELTPFLSVVALQLFAYYVARYRGCDIDQPRNLAKSVTVE